jgi:hypothetical protein
MRTMWAGDVVIVVVVSLVLAAVLNADSLLRRAEQKPFGDERDFWVGVWEPVQTVSDGLLLNRPRQALDEILERDSADSSDRVQGMVVLGTDGTPPPLPGASEQAEPTPAAPAGLRVPSAEDPLRIWVGGDSIAEHIAESLARIADDTGQMTTEINAQIATGLTRPDYFDWPAELSAVVGREAPPDVLIVMFGGNDNQGMPTPLGDVYRFPSPGWREEYRQRVGALLDSLTAPDRLVIWMGLPPMRDDAFSEEMQYIDSVYREEVQKRPGVVYLDLWELFGQGRGEYTPYFEGLSGEVELMREPDGMHVSREGGDLVAQMILDRINAELETATPTPATTSEPTPVG